MLRLVLCFALVLFGQPAFAHDIYTGVRNKTGMLCCGGSDCFATSYSYDKGRYLFKTKENEWVEIPEQRILFLPLPGDAERLAKEDHPAHMCYRHATDYDRLNGASENVFSDIYLYCAFIPPGSI